VDDPGRMLEGPNKMLIDCDTCGDCVVAVLLGPRTGGIELDSAEQSALSAFAEGGLLPPLRLVPTYSTPDSAEPATTTEPDESDGGRTAIA
jgi:hypothetical protein